MTALNSAQKAGASSTLAEQNLREGGDSGQANTSSASAPRTKSADLSKNEKLIISIHIPKTGGTAFTEVLRQCAEEVFYMDYGSEPLAPTALFHRGKPLTTPFEAIASDIQSLPGRSVIHGHFPAEKYTSRFPTAVYMTWLRDPVERIVSNYLYWQRSQIPGDVRWEEVTGQKMSLEQFAQLDFVLNIQCEFLVPLAIEDFAFIGITEEYDRSLELFRRLFCPDARFDATVHNDNPNRKGKFYDLDPQVRKKIRLLNERDVHAYVDGVRRFRYLCEQVGL